MKIISNLPTLTGTEKQIAWAEKIRQQFVNHQNEQTEFKQGKIDRQIAKGRDAETATFKARRDDLKNIRFALFQSAKLCQFHDTISDLDALEVFDRSLECILAQTDSGWWIDHRDSDSKWIQAAEKISA